MLKHAEAAGEGKRPHIRSLLERLSEVAGAPIDLVSTGPDRDETILIRHPFQ